MQIPFIYPEANNIKLSAEYAVFSRYTGIYIDKAVISLLPGIPEMIAGCLPTAVEWTDAESADIVIRQLSEEDIRFAGFYFKREYLSDDMVNDVFFIHITDKKAVISALNKEGFLYALQIFRCLVCREKDGMVRIKKAVIFDYAHLKIRAVSIKSPECSDIQLFDNLLRIMAELRYNTLIFDKKNAGILTSEELVELELLCCRHNIKLTICSEEELEVINDLDGPAFLDWEHKSVGVGGAAVPLTCSLNTTDMAGTGFLFNLAYSAYMLWNREYNNFSWEKVNDLAHGYIPLMMEAFDNNRICSIYNADADIYPIPLQYDIEKHRTKPAREIACGKTGIIAKAGERAECLIFTHAIEGNSSNAVNTGHKAGHYTVNYNDGTSRELHLTENRNIGRSDIWTGRRYNAWKHAYDTDRRLQVISCYAGIEKRALGSGKLSVVYNLRWINPYPDTPIEDISLTVSMNEEPYVISVYEIKILNELKGRQV